VAPYDTSLPLVIDPVLIYSTYLGGSGEDSVSRIAVDREGSAYVVGTTNSLDFPGQSAYQGRQGDLDIFVSKLSPSATASFTQRTWVVLAGHGRGRCCGRYRPSLRRRRHAID